jgi:hypothetical protein
MRLYPNLSFSQSFISNVEMLSIPLGVTLKIRNILLRLSHLDESFREENGYHSYQINSFLVYRVHCNSYYYFLLVQGNTVITLLRKCEKELTEKDWENVKL